ncbi:hypothetical protein BDB01DRAFT_843390 [Pilobolus umbonatus]|nr:hypothetical protein BDB01DRAFT_843390 [Pilobolus umbonatus]
MNCLPPPNSTIVSRRSSLATADYDYSSRSPSPSSVMKHRLHEKELKHPYIPNRRDSLPPSQPSFLPAATKSSLYNSFHRRHSIAADNSSQGNLKKSDQTTKYRPFHFPPTIHETSNLGTSSAPSSPPQLMHPYKQQDNYRNTNESNYPYQQNNQQYEHPVEMPAIQSPSFTERPRPYFNETVIDHSMNRRASMPVVTRHNEDAHGLEAVSNMSRDRYTDEKRKESSYSRTPELKVSHKLAERKRRREMKDLFDELRDSLPMEKSMKTSKWEILSKAIEYISLLRRRDYDLQNEVYELKKEIDSVKNEKTRYVDKR